MEEVKSKKNIYSILIIVFFIVLILVGGTYALSLWRSTENTMLTLRIGDISGVYCEVGNEINVSNLGPVFDHLKDGESLDFSVDNKTNEVTNVTAKFNIKSISTNLLDDSFKYALLYSTDNVNYTTLKEDTFKNASNRIVLLDNYSIPLSSKIYFKFIIYIDGNMENSINIQNGSLVGSVSLCKTPITTNNVMRMARITSGTNIANDSVESIDFIKISDLPSGVGDPLDISLNQDNTVLLYSKDGSTSDLKKIYIATDDGRVKLSSGYWLFGNLSKVVSLDLSNVVTTGVTDMYAMFYRMKSLTSLDLSNFDTSSVTEMSNMFAYMDNLTSIDVSNFDTSNVTNMSGMFSNMGSLTSLDVSSFDTSKVTSMSGMFSSMGSLTSLDVSKFNTSNVTNMSGMFYGMNSLTSLDVSKFNTSNVTNMSGMFSYLRNITSINVSNFDTSNVTDMSDMFNGGFKLTSLDISSFDTSKVTNMSGMFHALARLTSIDVSNFDTSNVTDMSDMFYSMPVLKTIYASDKFVTSKVTSSEEMFALNDNSLVGGNGTKWSSSYIDKTYARIDTASTPGYFTKK